eukprot:2415-Heterococcus_DN1.PRE.1
MSPASQLAHTANCELSVLYKHNTNLIGIVYRTCVYKQAVRHLARHQARHSTLVVQWDKCWTRRKSSWGGSVTVGDCIVLCYLLCLSLPVVLTALLRYVSHYHCTDAHNSRLLKHGYYSMISPHQCTPLPALTPHSALPAPPASLA